MSLWLQAFSFSCLCLLHVWRSIVIYLYVIKTISIMVCIEIIAMYYLYTYKAEILSVCHAVNSPGTVEIAILIAYHQKPSSTSFKFVTTSQCGDQLAFYSCLKTKKWRKLEQHSIENHSHIAQWVVQLEFRRSRVRIQVVNRFFFNINTFCKHIFL